MANAKMAVPSTMKKFTTVAELEQSEKGSVFVLNNLKGEYKGMIVIPVARKNGNGHDVVRVPPTFIPVDLTMQVSKVQLLDSTEFRQTINKGLIRLITKEYADTIMQQPEAQAEAQQVANNMSRARTMVEATLLSEGKKTGLAAMVNDAEDEDPEVDAAATAKAVKEKVPPSPKIVTTVKSALDKNLSSADILAKLKNLAPMKSVDLKYALRYFKTFPKVKTYLEAELEKKRKAKA